MKITSLIFIALILMGVFKYTKVFDIKPIIFLGVFVIWFIALYIQIHLKNKDRNTPRPVYMQN